MGIKCKCVGHSGTELNFQLNITQLGGGGGGGTFQGFGILEGNIGEIICLRAVLEVYIKPGTAGNKTWNSWHKTWNSWQ